MTQLWKSGILDKVTFSTLCTVMKALPLPHNSLHVETTSPLVVVTLLSWFGKAIWMKMNKSLSKISELNQLQMIMQEECQLLVRKDQRLLQRDKEQQEAQRQEEMDLHKNQLMDKLQELVEEIWTTIIIKLQQVMIQMLKVEAEKNWLKLLKKLWVSLISYLEHFMFLNKESAWTSHQSLVSLAISMNSKLNKSIRSPMLDSKTSGTLKAKVK